GLVVAAELGPAADLHEEADAVAHAPHVVVGGVVVVPDHRLGGGVGGGDGHVAAAGRLEDAGDDGEAVAGRRGQPLLEVHHRGREELDVGRGHAALGAVEGTRLGDVRGERTGPVLDEGLEVLGGRGGE